MSIGADFYTYVAALSSIRAIVGLSTTSPQKAAVYPNFLPQNHYGFPALTYTQDEDAQSNTLDGVSTLKEALLTADCWALTYLNAHSLANALVTDLVGYRGTFGTVTADFIRLERSLDLYESDTKLHRVSLQFRIAYY